MGLLDELTDNELRRLASLVAPVIKNEAIQVGKLPVADTTDGIYSLPGIQQHEGITKTVMVPISKLQGHDGSKGDSIEFVVLGSYQTIGELMNAYPDGPSENGFFKVGDMPYIWTSGKYEPLNLDVFRTFSLEQFIEITPVSGNITIDFVKTPYAKLTLSGDNKIFNLSINNTKDGSNGKILVFQTGFKQISVASNIKGTVDLPLNRDTIALLNYNRLGDTIYIHTNTVLGDIQFPTPQKVRDFMLVYSDTSVCMVQWSAPYANNIYDKVTEYDIRYSNSLVDADDPKVWSGLKKVPGVPEPAMPGEIQKMTISGLTPNKEYYVYLKSIKVNYGIEYSSDSSDFIYFKTLGSADTGKAFRISLTERNLIPQLRNYLTDTDGSICSIGNIVDETEKNVFLDDGYPDMKNKDYTTFWSQYKYSRDTSPFNIIIDLYSTYSIDKLFVYSRGKPYFSVYGMKELGYEWEHFGEIKIGFNEWKSLDFRSGQCRFIKLSFDQMDFGASSTSPVMPEGTEAFPEPEYNGSIDRIDNVLLYGRPVSTRPDGIMSPLRRSTVRKTVDQFFCTNGHAYQQGRIHSMCSGERMRMYIHFGHFAVGYGTPDAYTRLADMRFKVSDIPWVSGNNGSKEGLQDMLLNTYHRYGLKPFLCNTGVFDYCYYNRNQSVHNRPCDGYWLPGAWRPVPKRGVRGLDRYFGITTDAASYRTYAKLCQALAAKYGRSVVSGTGLFYDTDETTGLNLLSGIEPENEPDQNWSGWLGYTHAEEYAAILSASADGHDRTLTDEDGILLSGIKGGDIQVVSSGTASVNRGYLLPAILHWKSGRHNAGIPIDVFSMHMYFSNIGSQDASKEAVQYGITFEEAMKNNTGGELIKMIEFRNRFAPDKEIALTEFGWGESGGHDTASKYQCYTQPGCKIGDWTVPDRHRSDVKGAWIVRACVQMMKLGVDFVNYYSTETESNYFGSGNWDSGAGFEMFHWNDCTDTTPGAKAEAIRRHEHSYARGGFATTGLFGQILGNGAYPITRSYWWVATMRNRLKGYIYTGMKYINTDERIVVACFKKQDEDKGAYVVYLNDNRNTGIAGVEIPVPEGVGSVRHVTVHIPDIPNPQNVPGDLGNDHARTGLPGARHERYVNGEWILAHQPYYQDRYASYAQGPALYPESPQEGCEVVVLPTTEENPYFPIAGPVQAKNSSRGNNLSAQQYETDREEWQDEPNVDAEGNIIWSVKNDISLSWRQVEAVCDYIDYHPEGIHGRTGNETIEESVRGMIRVNVSEFPEYFFFDAIPEPDFKSLVTDFSSRTISASAVELFWNNTNTEDTGYQIFVSELPEAGYNLLKEIPVAIENRFTISGLSPDTTYYYKIRPVKDRQAGTMSDYTSVRTYSELPSPDNLRMTSRTVTSVTLEWEYTPNAVADFVYYAIYRAEESGEYIQAGKVEDKSILTYIDNGLLVGHTYKYKIRAIGLNGQSEYSKEITTRTLMAEECSPTLLRAMTDKLGSKIILTFDLPIGIISATAKESFTLTEDGNLRLIQAVSRDEANTENLILYIPEDSLKDYDHRSDVRISYMGTGIESVYGITLNGFSKVKVVNVIGNFTNLEATYKINFTGTGSPLPQDEEWNSIIGNPETETISVILKDTYQRVSDIIISPIQSSPKYSWSNNIDYGYCEIEGIEQAVFKYGWRGPGFKSDVTENIVARLQLSGLKDEYRYTIRHFGGTKAGSGASAKIKVGNKYSGVINQKDNGTSYLVIEDCQSTEGILNVDVINAVEDGSANFTYPITTFMIIEEYKSNDAPENTDVFLRGATVIEAVDDIVKFPDITVHLNCIGTPTAYRISENQDMTGSGWVDILKGEMDVPYTISKHFGEKILYVQVKNLYGESNIRTINVVYRDPYVPLVLKNIYINNDDSRTYTREVTVMADMDGIPAYYRISESPDLSTVEWRQWPDPKVSEVSFTLSQAEGQKTVYMQIMDDKSVCDAKADTISLVIIERKDIILTITLPDGIDSGAVNASFPVLKYNKKFIFTYTADDCPVGAYGKVFRAINKKWVDDEKYYHKGQVRTTGYIPDTTLGYTDGCGKEHRMPVGVAIWPNLGNDYIDDFMDRQDEGKNYPYLIWPETLPIMDFGGALYWHNVNERAWYKNDPLKILEGLKEDQLKTVGKSGRGMKVMMRPDGNNNYITAAVMAGDVVMMCGENSPAIELYPSDNPDLFKVTGMRRIYSENNDTDFAWIKAIHDSDNPQWCHLFTHTPGQPIVDLLTRVNNNFGKDGDDSAWMATVDEVYEYWFVRKNAMIRKEAAGQTVEFILSIPSDQYFYHKDICVVVDGIASVAGLSIKTNDAVNGLNYGINNGNLLINVNYDDHLPVCAEKYTSAFEHSLNEEDRSDAMYFISLLRQELSDAYLARIEAITQPPVLNEFYIYESTPSGTDTPDIGFYYSTDERATHYCISESPTFEGAEWKIIRSANENFTLTNVPGLHTLYLKVKNQFGESRILSGSITYTPQEIELIGVSVNFGAPSTTAREVSVGITYNGIPTHYRAGELSDLSDMPWSAFSERFVYSFASPDYGTKTVYVQLKDEFDNVSSILSDEIDYVEPEPVKTIVSFSNSYNNISYEPVGGKVVNCVSSSLAASYSTLAIRDSSGAESCEFCKNPSDYPGVINVDIAPLNENMFAPSVDDSGTYPAKYISKHVCNGNAHTGLKAYFRFNNLKTGNYKVRLLTSCGEGASIAENNYNKIFYQANGMSVNINFNPVNNMTQFIDIDNVNVGTNGRLDISFWNTGGMYYRPGLNLIEIIKI